MSPARKKERAGRVRRAKRRKKSASPVNSIAWIRSLAAPYLRGYLPAQAQSGPLIGYWFCAPAGLRSAPADRRSKPGEPPYRGQSAGFFVGYLVEEQGFSILEPQPPECIFFAWVHPFNSPLHRRLVHEPGSLIRKTFEYIRWLTHRPPRFVFHEAALASLTRHQSMRDWPADKHPHLSRNFFIETLAWLVRSGMVRKLREEVTQEQIVCSNFPRLGREF